MKNLFWLSITIIFYTYIIYPVLIYLLSLLYKKPVRGKYGYPIISILITMHAEDNIDGKNVAALKNLNYPSDRLEIITGKKEKGEASADILNTLAVKAKGELLVFINAQYKLDKDALGELVKNFSNDKVGSVSGELIYENQDKEINNGTRLYWKYEKFIRKSESRMGSMLGASGTLYAIRKSLYPILPKELILDDVYIPMTIIRKGFRAVFDKRAKVYHNYSINEKVEFLKNVRNSAGIFQLFTYFKELFNPLKGKISWQFFSHKFLRLIVPFLLIALLASNIKIGTVYGDSTYFYQIFLWLQIVFYTLALLAVVFKKENKLFDIPHMFCVMNIAAVIGLYQIIFKKTD